MRGFDSCYPCLTNTLLVKKSKVLSSKILPSALPKLALPHRLRVEAARRVGAPNDYTLRRLSPQSAVLKRPSRGTALNRKRRLANKLALTKVFNFKSNLATQNLIFAPRSNANLSSEIHPALTLCADVTPNRALHLWVQGDSNLYFSTKVSAAKSGLVAGTLSTNLGVSKPVAGSPHTSAWFSKTLIDAASSLSGKKSLLQFYPFLSSSLSKRSVATYKSWIPRLLFYQKRLGHRFFMEESLHVMHTALNLHDASLFAGWLKSLIKRISFWKTRSIFRYLVYLFNNFFTRELEFMGCKGIRIRLKGKISAAGNSRKRSISLSFGKVSYSTLDIKCLSDNTPISTFTGAMCLRTQIFY